MEQSYCSRLVAVPAPEKQVPRARDPSLGPFKHHGPGSGGGTALVSPEQVPGSRPASLDTGVEGSRSGARNLYLNPGIQIYFQFSHLDIC